jgi:hypothetical protein
MTPKLARFFPYVGRFSRGTVFLIRLRRGFYDGALCKGALIFRTGGDCRQGFFMNNRTAVSGSLCTALGSDHYGLSPSAVFGIIITGGSLKRLIRFHAG